MNIKQARKITPVIIFSLSLVLMLKAFFLIFISVALILSLFFFKDIKLWITRQKKIIAILLCISILFVPLGLKLRSIDIEEKNDSIFSFFQDKILLNEFYQKRVLESKLLIAKKLNQAVVSSDYLKKIQFSLPDGSVSNRYIFKMPSVQFPNYLIDFKAILYFLSSSIKGLKKDSSYYLSILQINALAKIYHELATNEKDAKILLKDILEKTQVNNEKNNVLSWEIGPSEDINRENNYLQWESSQIIYLENLALIITTSNDNAIPSSNFLPNCLRNILGYFGNQSIYMNPINDENDNLINWIVRNQNDFYIVQVLTPFKGKNPDLIQQSANDLKFHDTEVSIAGEQMCFLRLNSAEGVSFGEL